MNPERWRQIDQLLEAALEREPDDGVLFYDPSLKRWRRRWSSTGRRI